MSSANVDANGVPLVRCVRCAVAAAHPFAFIPERCVNCGRTRS